MLLYDIYIHNNKLNIKQIIFISDEIWNLKMDLQVVIFLGK